MVISHGTPMTFGPSLIPIIEVWYDVSAPSCYYYYCTTYLPTLVLFLDLGKRPRRRPPSSSLLWPKPS